MKAFTDLQANNARFRFIVNANDELTTALSKDNRILRNTDRGAMHKCRKYILAADRESAIQRALDLGFQSALDLADARVALSSQVEATQPKFATGQSLLQWWASWFSTTGPGQMKQFNTKSRPKWYSSEIISVGHFQDISYAGGRVNWPHVLRRLMEWKN